MLMIVGCTHQHLIVSLQTNAVYLCSYFCSFYDVYDLCDNASFLLYFYPFDDTYDD